MTNREFVASIRNIFQECLVIVEAKNKDYGGDIDALNNFRLSEHVGIPMTQAILVRMSDKLARIGTLLQKEAQVKDESIEDTLKDLANYSVILLTVIRSLKPSNSHKSPPSFQSVEQSGLSRLEGGQSASSIPAPQS